MANGHAITEGICNRALKELALELSNSETLFALEGDEEAFGPEDWAWLFLRCNQEYVEAFYAQREKVLAKETPTVPNSTLSFFLADTDNPDIIFDEDGSCRQRFGLAAWLNSDLKRLPALEDGGHWFFPLMSPVSENYERKKVSLQRQGAYG